MKKLLLACSILMCCGAGFAQNSTAQKAVPAGFEKEIKTEPSITIKRNIIPYLVGALSVYRNQYYTYSVNGAEPGSVCSAWSTTDNSIARLDNASGLEGTFYIAPRPGSPAPVSFTVFVQVYSGGVLYYLSMASLSITCNNCPID